MQGRPRGGKNNYHSKEEKIKIVKEMLDCNFSPFDIEKNMHSMSISNFTKLLYALGYKLEIIKKDDENK